MALLQWLIHIHSTKILYLFASVLLAVTLKFVLQDRFRKRKLNLPPSPPKLPIIGNLHQLGTMPHISLRRLAAKHGPIMFLRLGEIPTLVLSSPRLAKELLTTHDIAFSNRPKLVSARSLFYGCTDIAFAPPDAYWRSIKKICNLELLSAKRVKSFSFVREGEVARLGSRIAEPYPGPVNLSKLLGLYANDVICRVVLGKNFSEAGEYDRHGFHDMLHNFLTLLGGFSLGDYFPSLGYVQNLTSMKSKLQTTFEPFDQFFDEVISEHLYSATKSEEQKDLVDILLDIQKSGSSEMPLNMNNIKPIMLDAFAGGTDTTFVTLDWAMTELIMHPSIMRKAQAELSTVVGEKRKVEDSDLQHLHFMKAILKETFRLHPAGPLLIPRESMEDSVIDGYNIPAKTRVYLNVWAIGRDPKIWENPETFEPERFMGSSIDFTGRNFELLPFGAGRRGCPGISFGTAVMELGLAQLLHSFDWELPPGVTPKDIDNREFFGLGVGRTVPLHVIAKPRFNFRRNSS
ncbi:hypothetical protein K2173_001006 [Erythroxylum novogranatense]|uniref:Cytochrome P450 n=1 Tax=Erythroxylum novogranatense TaxID=1862640 RepID=A0AAV8S770_9ROSI|nr:hypothetical protein K2173_001006 [Erythroxylum novogranatense]